MSNNRYDWNDIASKLEYPHTVAMWTDLYITRNLSTAAIARKFGVSQNTIRSELAGVGIPFRSRGGPNNAKMTMTEEIAQAIKERGMSATAKELGVKYGTLYKRYVKYKGLHMREEVRQRQAGEVASDSQHPEGGSDHATNR